MSINANVINQFFRKSNSRVLKFRKEHGNTSHESLFAPPPGLPASPLCEEYDEEEYEEQYDPKYFKDQHPVRGYVLQCLPQTLLRIFHIIVSVVDVVGYAHRHSFLL